MQQRNTALLSTRTFVRNILRESSECEFFKDYFFESHLNVDFFVENLFKKSSECIFFIKFLLEPPKLHFNKNIFKEPSRCGIFRDFFVVIWSQGVIWTYFFKNIFSMSYLNENFLEFLNWISKILFFHGATMTWI